MKRNKRGEKDGVAAPQFQSATVVKDNHLEVTAVVFLAHTDPLITIETRDKVNCCAKTRLALDRKD